MNEQERMERMERNRQERERRRMQRIFREMEQGGRMFDRFGEPGDRM